MEQLHEIVDGIRLHKMIMGSFVIISAPPPSPTTQKMKKNPASKKNNKKNTLIFSIPTEKNTQCRDLSFLSDVQIHNLYFYKLSSKYFLMDRRYIHVT